MNRDSLVCCPDPSTRAADAFPRCSTRTDQLIRMEDARKGMAVQNSRCLIPCPQCNLSFYCSQAHLDIARTLHHGPCEDAPHGHQGLSQCEIHREYDAQTKFEAAHPSSLRVKWSPPRVLDAWTSVAGLSWEREFNASMRESLTIPSSPVAPWIRAASDDLSMIMTILYGLEKLNGDDIAWTRKHTLTIHIIGAAKPEVARANHPLGFEEILYRLPEVKTLKLVLCGPNIPRDLAQKIFDCHVCPADCAVVKTFTSSLSTPITVMRQVKAASLRSPISVSPSILGLRRYHKEHSPQLSRFSSRARSQLCSLRITATKLRAMRRYYVPPAQPYTQNSGQPKIRGEASTFLPGRPQFTCFRRRVHGWLVVSGEPRAACQQLKTATQPTLPSYCLLRELKVYALSYPSLSRQLL
ncbi:hypothetical protein B0H19DRAFT_283012 [Mycena capillaripes]|nr:hypothetical protein B0H19DRAFT_283012 [Mycena capillaripes]